MTTTGKLPVHKLIRPRPQQLSGAAATASEQPAPQPVVLVGCGSYNPPTVMHLRMFDLAADALRHQGQLEVWGGYLSPVSDAYRKPGLAPAAHRLAMCEAAAASHPFVACDPWEVEQPQYTRTLQVLQRYQEEVTAWWEAGGRPQVLHPPDNDATSTQQQEQQQAQAAAAPQAANGIHLQGATSHQAADEQASWPQGPPRVMLLCGEHVLLSMTIPGVWEDPDSVLTQYGAMCIERLPASGTGGTGSSQGGSAVAMGAAIAPSGTVTQGLGSLQEALEQPGNVLSRCRQHIHVVRDAAQSNISSTLVRKELKSGRSVRYLVPDGVARYLEHHPGIYA